MTKKEILDKIAKDFSPRKKKIEAEYKALSEKFKEAVYSVDSILEKGDEAVIKFNIKFIEKATEQWANMLSRTEKMLLEVEELQADEGVLVGFDEIKTLTQQLSDLSTKFNKYFTAGKASLDKLNDALEEHKPNARDATEEWAVMEAWLKKQQEIRKKGVGKIEAAREAARKAAAARNAKALAEAAKTSDAVVDGLTQLEDIQEDYTTFCTKFEAQDLDKNTKDQLARDRKTFDGIMDEITSLTAKIVSIDVEIQGLEIPKPDAKTAAAELEIPNSHLAKLEKALAMDLAAMEKALGALAKELKMKTTGKEMIATLKKAGLL